MKKCCNRYPNCKHFNDWDKPAKEIDETHSELFHDIMCEAVNPIIRNVGFDNYENTIESFKNYLKILPSTLQPLFVEKITDFLRPYCYEAHRIKILDYTNIKNALMSEVKPDKPTPRQLGPQQAPGANQGANKPKKDKIITNNFSQKQIAIAYHVMKIMITKDNAADILLKYSQTRSVDKFLQKRITGNVSAITQLTENKTVDTKHKQDLLAAKRLVSGMKNEKAQTDIDRFIATFKTNYDNHY